MYTTINFKTKKQLKEAVAVRLAYLAAQRLAAEALNKVRPGCPITVYQPNADVTGFACPRDGKACIEGPHYPEPHRWYAEVTLKDGEIIKVK